MKTSVIRIQMKKETRYHVQSRPGSSGGTLGPIHFSWDQLGTRTPRFMVSFGRLGGVRAIESSRVMERAMGIEPTSEAWEVRNKNLESA
jgi:hypothetical protein